MVAWILEIKAGFVSRFAVLPDSFYGPRGI